jgi:restriction endonuclease
MGKLAALKTDLARLSDDDFELLVYRLIRTEHPQAQQLDAPDGGADILIPLDGSPSGWVVQVKQYPNKIHWVECETSLQRAVERFAPKRTTFVFARNLTAPMLKTFRKKR